MNYIKNIFIIKMNDVQKRIILFFCGCIVVRALFVIIAKYINIKYLPYLGILALITSILFLYRFIIQKDQIGAFGGKVWWNNMRLVHSFLYLLFAILAITKKDCAWIVLLGDLIIGIIAFSYQYYFKN